MNCTACLVSPERSRGARVLRPELAERARQELCRTRSTLHSQLSIANCALAMSALANPMLPRTGRTSGPASSAPNRAGPLEIQTHQLCPPGHISPLEYALTKNGLVNPLESALTEFLDLKLFRFRTYKKRGGGGVPLALGEPPAWCARMPLAAGKGI